jgi:alpha,alpha-trehalase
MNKYIQTEGELFEKVQLSRIFPDSKTFVDSCPSKSPEDILKKFHKKKDKSDFDLKKFIEKYFILPETIEKKIETKLSMEEHIKNLWDTLAREADEDISPYSTLIPLPCPYIVPGGRFREIYYWDSYFTSEGLSLSGKLDMVEYMIKNFASLIDKYGHVPNGNRVYYLGRSQPPFFCSMIEIPAHYKGIEAILPYLETLEKEYLFWMEKRSVLFTDGTVLNRYWDDNKGPREESYREDIEIYKGVNDEQKENLYRNIRAACESGWDFSSRWFQDYRNLSTVRTTEILPVDLNSLLYNMEVKLSEWFSFEGNEIKSKKYAENAEIRLKLINKYFWDRKKGFFFDYSYKDEKKTDVWSLAGLYPLFFKIATEEEAEKVAEHISEKFLYEGGLVTTLNETGQQWDKPNGWAPLQWIAVKGLEFYGYNSLAEEIAKRFVNLASRVFEKTGKMMEKYNVCDMTLVAGGGEYPLQDGFGWTNGIVSAMGMMINRDA